MLTVGVDLAAEHLTTAVASIRWTDDGAVVEAVMERARDDVLLAAIEKADKAAIDCPLGWPAPFVEFVVAHHAGSLTRLGRYEETCRRSDHAFDAVVAALTARAAALGRVTRPDAEDLDVARVEGWIALPTAPLADLVG